MRTRMIIAAAALGLVLATGTAHADHDSKVGYVVGGVLLGAALADLAHDRHHHRHYVYETRVHGYAPRYARRTYRHGRHFRGHRHAPRRHRVHVHHVYH